MNPRIITICALTIWCLIMVAWIISIEIDIRRLRRSIGRSFERLQRDPPERCDRRGR